MGSWRLVLTVFLSTVAVFAGFGVVGGPERHEARGREGLDPGERELRTLLMEVRATWKPQLRTRVAQRARDRIGVLQQPLIATLQSGSPFIEEAVYLAVEWRLRQAHRHLAKLATSSGARGRTAAIVAADRFRPWSPEELEGFLRSDEPEVLVIALDLASKREQRPLAEIFRLLGHREVEVREAALSAVPASLPTSDVHQLIRLALGSVGARGVYALKSLSKIGIRIDRETESELSDLLWNRDEQTRVAVLELLSIQPRPLRDPTRVWNIANNEGLTGLERAKALLCLERTGSFDPKVVRYSAPSMPPFVRYFAARCMIAAGDKEGVRILLGLLDADAEWSSVEEGHRDTAKFAARKLLADLTRTRIHEDPEAWWVWLARTEELALRTLPLPPFAF